VAGFCTNCNELLVQYIVGNFVNSSGEASCARVRVRAWVGARINMDEEFSVSVMIMQLICSHGCTYSASTFHCVQ
jgi:hypothetical protein